MSKKSKPKKTEVTVQDFIKLKNHILTSLDTMLSIKAVAKDLDFFEDFTKMLNEFVEECISKQNGAVKLSIVNGELKNPDNL